MRAGQGWGINRISAVTVYGAMRRFAPDFHPPGDQIYADGPIQSSVTLEDGTVEEHHLAGKVQGGRDAGRFPGQLRLQPV